jgi:glycosyltransferase involved in cell wall biosynthesis
VTENDEAVPVESVSLLDTANPLTYASTAKAIRNWDPDILIMKYWMPYFAPSLGFVARHMEEKCKVIPILDNVIPHEKRFIDNPLTKYFLSGCTGCIAMCKEVADDLKILKPEAKCEILPHPLYSHFGEKLPRTVAERDLGLMPDKKNILFFGLIRDYKGLDILLEAFRELDDDYQLIIAGEPYGSFDKYQKMIDDFDGRDRIKTFPKYIRDSEVKDYFSAADVTVLPYRSATQSGISSISYHFEVPMIVTDVGGLKGTIGDSGTGIVASEATPELIRKEIETYFSNPGIKERCMENIRKEKIRLSWNTFCTNLLNFAAKL